MNENKNRTFILSVLLVVLAFSLLSMVARIKARLNKYKRTTKTTVPSLISKEAAPEESLEKIFAKMEIKRDPFVFGGPEKNLAPAGESQGSLELTAIAWDKSRPLAIINNEVLGIGDEIGGAKIVAIEEDKVKLARGNEVFELTLTQEGGQ